MVVDVSWVEVSLHMSIQTLKERRPLYQLRETAIRRIQIIAVRMFSCMLNFLRIKVTTY